MDNNTNLLQILGKANNEVQLWKSGVSSFLIVFYH